MLVRILAAALAAAVFVLPSRAQSGDAPWLDLGLDRAIDWIRDPEVFVDARRPKRRLEEEVDRTVLLDRALQRARDERKPVLWYVYRIVEESRRGVQMYRAPVLDVYAQQVLFADPDVASIVDRRFVPLRMVCDEAMSERFDLRPLQFVEPALVFLDGDGEVLHAVSSIRTFNAHWLAELLRRVLAEHPGGGTAAGDGAADVAALTADGRWEQALAGLEGDDSAEAHLRAAALLRRLRRPEGAVAHLQEVGGDAPPDLRADADVERGRILTMRGRPVAAIAALQPVLAGGAGSRLAEAAYLLAWNRLQTGDEDGARAAFGEVAAAGKGSLWARRAAANLMIGNDERPVGAAFCGFEDLGYLPDAAYVGLPPDTSWAGEPRSPERIASDGVRFLLRQQRDHGGFTDSRYAYWSSPVITPNAWIAISALAAAALLEHRDVDPEAVDEALARAERFLFDPARLNRGENEDVYADAYRLIYLSRKHARSEPAERAAAVDRMNAIVHEARQRQQRSGFFAHEYPNAFCTAAMVEGLLAARGAGADVPEEMLDQAGAALLSARHENGAFSYGGSARGKGRRKDSSGRMPACEGALWALGRSDPDKVAAAFETFWDFFDRLEGVRRNDFHSDGELAGFFFFHDLFHASEVNERLPAERRDDNRRKLLRVLQRVAEMDGSYVDSHEIGRSYGTAMALLTLANVTE